LTAWYGDNDKPYSFSGITLQPHGWTSEILTIKEKIEPILLSIDWLDAGKQLLKRKDEWHHLEFFEQSDWKCNYFNVPKERFKMVIWE
jgi:hypothetical protein